MFERNDTVTDEARAQADLAARAARLGGISARLNAPARDAVRTYRDALGSVEAEPWRRFVEAADTLVRESAFLDSVGALRSAEHNDRAYFAAIVSENADLLPLPNLAA